MHSQSKMRIVPKLIDLRNSSAHLSFAFTLLRWKRLGEVTGAFWTSLRPEVYKVVINRIH